MSDITAAYTTMSIFLILLLFITQAATQSFIQGKQQGVQCPIGFSYLPATNLCYQVKRKETYSQKYDRCSGNEVSLDFREEYKQALGGYQINLIWTDYVRMYDGGPFVNWRYEDNEMGKPANVTVQSESIFHRCAYIEISTGIVKSDFCNNTHARLCVIRPYSNSYVFYWDCPPGYIPFPTPVPSCLIAKSINTPSSRRVSLRATWQQASLICNNNFGFLPQRGYIYLNHEEFLNINKQDIPLGITVKDQVTTWVRPYGNNESVVSLYEQQFVNPNNPLTLSGHVALSNSKWFIKESNVVYNNAVCEAFVHLPVVDIKIISQNEHRLYVNVSEDIKLEDLWCFTDSFTYYPIKINIYRVLKKFERTYFLETIGNGYYWCLLVNAREFIPRKSDKYLFVSNNDDLKNVFAIKIRFYKDITFSDYFIKEYLKSFFSDYNLVFGNNKSEVLSSLEDENGNLPQYMLHSEPLLDNITVKYLYYGENTALIHASFVNDFVKNYRLFKYFHFVYVKNVKYCEAMEGINQTPIGVSIYVESECKRYTCGGNFNEGATWLISDIDDNCKPRTTIIEVPENTTTVTTTTTEITTVPDTTKYTTTPYVETTTQTTTGMPPLNPEEEIDNVLNIIDEMLNGSVNSTQLDEAVHIISNLFESLDHNVTFPSAILQSIDAMLYKVDLPDNQQNLMVVRPSLAVVVADKSRNSSVTGIKLKSAEDSSLSEDALHLLTEDYGNIYDEKDDIIVRIPQGENFQGRLMFSVFKDDKPFSQNVTRVNSRVLSVSVTGMNIFEENKYIDMHFRPQATHNENESKVCAYWDLTSESNGKWKTDGCILLPSKGPGGLDTCRCTHLTHFAQLITGSHNHFGRIDYNALTIISMVGCVLSLIGLIVIALTGMIFRSWRSDFSNKIWLQLSTAMAILIFTFLLIAFGDVKKEREVYCIVTGVLLHYSVLASFSWMFIAAILSYQRLVTVFTKSSSHKLLKACICGWIMPFVPIGFLFSFDSNNYSQHFTVDELSSDICYPSGLGLWLAVFLPIALIVVVNAVLFFMIVYSVFINSKIKRHGDNKQLFRSITVSFLLFFLFGLTWIFGLFSHNIVMAYLFCITATNQGLVLCLFFIIGNKKTRDLWLVQLKLKEKKKIPVTTSMSRSYPSKSGKIQSIKRGDDDFPTKPRSLTGGNDKSDSRFS